MEFIKINNGKLFKGSKPFLLRGFGLGGWLLPEGYMWKLFTKCDRPRRIEAMIEALCGSEYASKFWDAYYEAYITEQDIAWIANNGFNSVRLPLNSRHLYDITSDGLVFNINTITRVDKLIKWCKSYNIYVILDLHGAPGGQTGQNIDDSEDDFPRLFMENHYQQELIELWVMLADRYKEEPTVAGFDLLNEPLPKWFSQYNHMLMPLYRTLIYKIREIDCKHIIILEGLHWATDFSLFDSLSYRDVPDGIMLEFHKYWSHPDKESLAPFIEASHRLNVPLFMGEGGENNLEWYTTIFPLYERLNISWSFWTYKKMDCINSPITFKAPSQWSNILEWIDGNIELSQIDGIKIFDELLFNIKNSNQNISVFNALNRKIPVKLPAEAYDTFLASDKKKRLKGANLRLSEPIDILFKNGRTGDVDYKRYGGEPQPLEENLIIRLQKQESIGFVFQSDNEIINVIIQCTGEASLMCKVEEKCSIFKVIGPYTCNFEVLLDKTQQSNNSYKLNLTCINGNIEIDTILLR